ncbi:MAG: peptidase S41, partial [Parabacteroides sp.]|nr:peptidase S41 [Parabacteroides sp.]
MKKLLILTSALLLTGSAFAENDQLWMRYTAISTNGEMIAFTYKGDIYTVPTTGGKATQLTTHPAHDTRPVWSPDGKQIAFASDRNGNFDVFIMNKEGGAPTQLTVHSANEYPETFSDNDHVLYSASIQQDVKDSQFPSSLFAQIYQVGTQGGRPELFSSLAMENLAFSKDGKQVLYNDFKGYEDPWRKHHQSSITRDIWLCTLDNDRTFKKITSFRGEDRDPVWSPDGNAFYYLSEEKGSFNIFKNDLTGKSCKQITNHTTHPVRFLTSDKNGTLCYGYDGEIYTVKEGGQPAKVKVSIISDQTENNLIHRLMSSGANSIAVSPNGKEVAFIVRGDVYVTSVEYETTRQITDTPQQERNIDFSPDGRSLVYSAERGETWGIYQSSLVRKDDKYFTYAQEIKEEPLVVTDKTSFQPTYSPDGKEVAFLEDRTTLCVINLKSKQVRTVLDGKYNYSYADGDQTYQWSPDSKWFLVQYIAIGGWNNKDIALVKADGSGDITNLTESGYSDGDPKWVLDGKAIIWSSDRAGYRSHGSWGAQDDTYIMFFDAEAYDKFRLSNEELALVEDEEKDKDKDKDKDKKDDKKEDKKDSKAKKDDKKKDDKDKKDDADKPVEPLKFDLENRKDRVIRLTINSSNMGDAVLTPKGDKLYYCAAFESGYDLWERNFKENSTKILIKGVGGGRMFADKKGENMFLVSGGQLKKVEIKDSK